MTVTLEIPVIDLAGSDGAEREKLCKEVVRACEQWGFFQVINHGVDESLKRRALDVYTDFFYLSPEEKMKVVIPEGSLDGWMHPDLEAPGAFLKNFLGPYTPEFLNNTWLPDLPQHRQRLPTNPSSFQSTILEFQKAARGLHENLLQMMAEGLGLESDAFLKHLPNPGMKTRSNFYPLVPADTYVGPNQAHSDASATTLLCDTVSGLEVMSDNAWVQVQSRSDGFIVNVGDQLEILSNGRFKSILHRGSRNTSKERLAVACFYLPNSDSVMAPIEELVVCDQLPKYRAIRFGDYFKSFIDKGNECKGRIEGLKITNRGLCLR
ncbi:hypothetical protein R1sor_024211 [Riccia sorocarpa]|uniref:Fe2OG dioxygenase domain-containing protein n=1 Tax=Riccia sorocarpa TaxID=122646 RepID=A0ABD3GPU7_9MARC